jgi:cation:H+ antiporter
MVHVEVIAGLVLLLVGGEVLVRGSVAVASRMGLSPMLIGLTLVGFGTSTPELMASVEAALRGAPGIAVGNIVGSNIANILLILGVSALIFPMATNRQAFRRDGPVLMAVTLLMAGAILLGRLGAATGAGFLVLLFAYLAFSYVMDRRRGDAAGRMHAAEAAEVMPDHPHVGIGLALTVGGIAGVVLGADLLVGGAHRDRPEPRPVRIGDRPDPGSGRDVVARVGDLGDGGAAASRRRRLRQCGRQQYF